MEARVSEVPLDVAQLEEMRRANDRLRGEVQRKTERIANLEKNSADMDSTLTRMKEMTEMASDAQEEIVSLKRQLELKSRALEQANESLKVAISMPRQRANTVTISSEIARTEDDLSSPQLEGVPLAISSGQISDDASSVEDGGSVTHARAHSNTPVSLQSLDSEGLGTPLTPGGSLASSYRSDSSMLAYDPSAAFLEQQQKARPRSLFAWSLTRARCSCQS